MDTQRSSGQTPTILLVDDEPDNLLVLEAVLEPLGVELVRASSGGEALECLRRRADDVAVVLLDVNMPGFDGFETAAEIWRAERGKRLPVIFVTARGRATEDVRRAYSVGAVDYIDKPFDPETLRAKVALFIELFRRITALQESEGRFRAIFAHAPIGVARVDFDGRCLEANPAFCRLLGYTEDELLRVTFVELTHPEDREPTLAFVAGLRSGEQSAYELEKRYVRKDGRVIWAHVASALVRGATGVPLYSIVLAQDISARKQAEHEEQHRQALLSNIPGAVYRFRLGRIWKLEFVSEPIEQITGYTAAQFMESPMLYAGLIHPDDQSGVTAALRLAIAEGRPHELEYRICHSDRTVRWVWDRARAVPSAEGPLQLDGVLLDVTEKKQTEAALRESEERARLASAKLEALIETSPLGIIATDADGLVTIWNPAAEHILGWSAAEVTGFRPPHLPGEATALEALRTSIEEGQTVTGEEELRRRRDGSLIEVKVSRAPLPDAGGGGQAVMGILEDISAQKRAERELERARQTEVERLELAAVTDHLTGLRNHRAFHEDLFRELARRDRLHSPLTVVLLDLDGLKGTNDRLGHERGDEDLRTVARCLRETLRDADAAYRIGGDEFALILPHQRGWDGFRLSQRLGATLAALTGPRRPSVTVGVAEATGAVPKDTLIRQADLALLEAKRSRRSVLIYSPEHEPLLAEPDRAAQQHHLQTLTTALARAVDAKDSYTRSHCETVSETCTLIAAGLGLEPERIAKIRLAGLLHDVGKIGIADAILQKPAALNLEEFETMKTHVELGFRIVSGAELEDEAFWILHHHERPDGRGYPEGLLGDAVPLESRIIHVADAFEAITSDRPYRAAAPESHAFLELERHTGTQFDSACVAALRSALEPGHPPAGRRSNGKRAAAHAPRRRGA